MTTVHPFKYSFIPARISSAEIVERDRQFLSLQGVICLWQRVKAWTISINISGEAEADSFIYSEAFDFRWVPIPEQLEVLHGMGHEECDSLFTVPGSSLSLDGSLHFDLMTEGADLADTSTGSGIWLPTYLFTLDVSGLLISSDVVVGGVDPALEPIGEIPVNAYDGVREENVGVAIPIRYPVKVDPESPFGYSEVDISITASEYWSHGGTFNTTTGELA